MRRPPRARAGRIIIWAKVIATSKNQPRRAPLLKRCARNTLQRPLLPMLFWNWAYFISTRGKTPPPSRFFRSCAPNFPIPTRLPKRACIWAKRNLAPKITTPRAKRFARLWGILKPQNSKRTCCKTWPSPISPRKNGTTPRKATPRFCWRFPPMMNAAQTRSCNAATRFSTPKTGQPLWKRMRHFSSPARKPARPPCITRQEVWRAKASSSKPPRCIASCSLLFPPMLWRRAPRYDWEMRSPTPKTRRARRTLTKPF